MIIIANILTMLMNVAGAIAAFWLGAAMLGILLLLMCGMHALWFFLARSRIPLAAELLKSSVDVLSTYKTVYAVNLMMCFLCAGFTILWGYAMVPPLDRANKGTAGVGTGFLIFFLLLSLFWTQQVVGNLMHVTTAGLTATWYFAGKNNMPRNPTLASFKRGVTTSFGSICFGSLLVAIIRVIRVIVSSAENSNHEVLRCIFLCIINCLENLLEYFNTYAFVHVAIYGCGYIEAAKKTWELCKQCAFAAIFNDSFIDVTLSLLIVGGSLLIGAIIGFLYFSYVAFAVAFLVSILVHSLLFAPITSGVTTFFVCYAEVPEGLQHSAPELYAAIHSADQNGTGNNAQAPRV
uniref:Choline transporter-like protein n=1 Tax=Trypanosoma congolense (strain IL3000) TaxID=1068625 RepID=G0UWQ0_TRYCI|nr:conserved hypothetical protein [Trypanosoma congolense IL3000]